MAEIAGVTQEVADLLNALPESMRKNSKLIGALIALPREELKLLAARLRGESAVQLEGVKTQRALRVAEKKAAIEADTAERKLRVALQERERTNAISNANFVGNQVARGKVPSSALDAALRQVEGHTPAVAEQIRNRVAAAVPSVTTVRPGEGPPILKGVNEMVRFNDPIAQQMRATAGPSRLTQAAKGPRVGRLGVGAAGGVLAALLAGKIFGGKDKTPQLPPELQMQLAAQLQGGQGQGVNTSRTLMDMGRLLNIIKTIQGMNGVMGAASPQPGIV